VQAAQFLKKFQETDQSRRKDENQKMEIDRMIAIGEKNLDQGKTAQALESFEEAVRLDPNNWAARGYLAELYLDAGDWQRASEHLVKMQEIDSDSPIGNYLMARYWYFRKEFGKARIYVEKVKLVRPSHAELRNLSGNINLALGRIDEALQEYQIAVKLAPERADFRENMQRAENRKLQPK
jgi:Tfp pilus assembly protein PilF